MLSACTSTSSGDLVDEGNEISLQLIAELKQIRSRDDLLVHSAKLEELFLQLVDVIIRADEIKASQPDELLETSDESEHTVSEKLRSELNRVIHMEGGREVIQTSQEKALNKLKMHTSS